MAISVNNLNGFYATAGEIKNDNHVAIEVLVFYTPLAMHERIEPFLKWFLNEAPETHIVSTLTILGEFMIWDRERDTTR